MNGIGLFFLRRYLFVRFCSRPLRTIAVVLSIAVGVSLFLATLFASEVTINSFASAVGAVEGGGGITIRSTSGVMSGEVQRQVARLLSGQFQVHPVFEAHVIVPVGEETRELTVYGIDFGGLPAEVGRERSRNGEAVLVLSGASAAALDVTSGNVFSVVADGRPLQVRVRVSSDLSLKGVGIGYVDVSQFVSWLPERSPRSLVVFPNGEGAISPEQIRAVQESLMAIDSSLYGILPEDTGADAAALLAAFRSNIGIMVLFTLVVTILLLDNSARMNMYSAVHDAQIMRTLGVTSRGLVLLFGGEALVLGSVGSLIGILLGAPITQVLTRTLVKTAQELYVPTVALSQMGLGKLTLVYLLTGLLGVGLSVIGALFPIRLLASLPPALFGRNDGVPQEFRSGKWLGILTLCGIAVTGVVLHVAWSQQQAWIAHAAVGCVVIVTALATQWIAPQLVRALGALLAVWGNSISLLVRGSLVHGVGEVIRAVRIIAVGLTLLIGLTVLVESFDYSLREWVALTFQQDIFVKPRGAADPRDPPILSEAQVRQIEALPGVSQVLRFRSTLVQFAGSLVTIAGGELREGAEAGLFNIIEGRFDVARFNVGEVVLVSESAARRCRLGPGAVVVLFGKTFTVGGVYRDYTRERGTILMGWDVFREATKLTGAESASVVLHDTGQGQSTIERIRGLFPEDSVSVLSNRELRSAIDTLFRNTFAVTGVIRVIVFSVCFAGLLIAMFHRSELRIAELRMLRALGTTRRQSVSASTIEALIHLFPGIVVGSIAGLGVGWILIEYVNPLSFGWTLTFTPAPMDLAVVACGIVLVTVVGAIGIGRMSWRRALIEQLSE